MDFEIIFSPRSAHELPNTLVLPPREKSRMEPENDGFGKRSFCFSGFIFRFHLSLRGCTVERQQFLHQFLASKVLCLCLYSLSMHSMKLYGWYRHSWIIDIGHGIFAELWLYKLYITNQRPLVWRTSSLCRSSFSNVWWLCFGKNLGCRKGVTSYRSSKFDPRPWSATLETLAQS